MLEIEAQEEPDTVRTVLPEGYAHRGETEVVIRSEEVQAVWIVLRFNCLVITGNAIWKLTAQNDTAQPSRSTGVTTTALPDLAKICIKPDKEPLSILDFPSSLQLNFKRG